MNKGYARGASLSLSVILSALFLGGCVMGNELEESEVVYAGGNEEEAVGPGEEAWKPGDICYDDKTTPQNECVGAVFTNVD
jgi:hypothetical protein